MNSFATFSGGRSSTASSWLSSRSRNLQSPCPLWPSPQPGRFYILFLLGIVLFHISLWGYGYQWFWSEWPTLQKISPIAAMALTAIGLNIYVARFIGISRRSQLGLGVLAINFVWDPHYRKCNLDMLAISMSATAASIVSSVILGAMVLYHVLSRRNAAIFISIAFGPFVVSAIVYSLQKLGLLEFGPWVSILPVSTLSKPQCWRMAFNSPIRRPVSLKKRCPK